MTAQHVLYYNCCRVHQTLSVTPAMEAGITEHAWTVEELVGLLEAEEAARSGPKKTSADRVERRSTKSNQGERRCRMAKYLAKVISDARLAD